MLAKHRNPCQAARGDGPFVMRMIARTAKTRSTKRKGHLLTVGTAVLFIAQKVYAKGGALANAK
jgi:hypothetical protein